MVLLTTEETTKASAATTTERDLYIKALIYRSYIFGHLRLSGHMGGSGGHVIILQLGERQGSNPAHMQRVTLSSY